LRELLGQIPLEPSEDGSLRAAYGGAALSVSEGCHIRGILAEGT
jgi:hypothetical protein